VIVGAGSAGIGIRDQIATAMVDEGAARPEAEARIMTLDSRGLIVEGRPNLPPGKQRLALSLDAVKDWQIDDHPIGLRDVVHNAQASVLIGVSGIPGVFTEEVIRRMALHAERPIIMPLSNPTSHAEVTPASAIEWTDGRAIVATGSPFPDVNYEGRRHRIGQANNVFVFPGMGLGVLTVGAREVSDRMFLAASKALADSVGKELVEAGQLYPSIADVRATSFAVAKAVANQAIADGIADPMEDVEQRIEEEMWFPDYLPYRPV
jgi:malate dehydrogenase (oxaloacetate-decarboxylating)